MENAQLSLTKKLNGLIDAELAKPAARADAPLVREAVDGILRLRDEKTYQITAARRAANVAAITRVKKRPRYSKTAKVLLIGALIVILLFALSMSVSGVRTAVYNFVTRHFAAYAEVIFDASPRKDLEHVYHVTAVPPEFTLADFSLCSGSCSWIYSAEGGRYIDFHQTIPRGGCGATVDNEETELTTITVDGQVMLCGVRKGENTGEYMLAWGADGYEFWLNVYIPGYTQEQALALYRSVR